MSELHSALESEVLFNQAGINFALEAWIAAKFAAARNDTSVRLVADQWPDIEIQGSNSVQRFEAVEVDVPGRQRGKEYKEAAEKERQGDETAWLAPEQIQDRSALVAMALRTAAKKKVEKRYSGRCSLIIMLNFGGEFGVGTREIGAILHASTSIAASAFEDVWLLWHDAVYLLWRNGDRVEIELTRGSDLAPLTTPIRFL